jgi:hypothetical protein
MTPVWGTGGREFKSPRSDHLPLLARTHLQIVETRASQETAPSDSSDLYSKPEQLHL